MRKTRAVVAMMGMLLSGLSAEEVSDDSQKIKKWASVTQEDIQSFPDQVSYALGYNIAKQILDVPEQFATVAGGKIKQELLMAGIIQSVLDKALIDDRKLAGIMDVFQKRSEVLEKSSEKGGASKTVDQLPPFAGEGVDWKEFLNQNKTKEGVVVTASGLQYRVLKQGTGNKPVMSDTVSVHYTGRLLDGAVFDSSVERGEPAIFPLSGVIAGWTEALQLMNVGSQYRLFIPPALGYGKDGAGDIIPSDAVLVFDVELISIEK